MKITGNNGIETGELDGDAIISMPFKTMKIAKLSEADIRETQYRFLSSWNKSHDMRDQDIRVIDAILSSICTGQLEVL